MKEDLKLSKHESVVCVMFHMLDGEFLNIVSCYSRYEVTVCLHLSTGDYEKHLLLYSRRCKVC